MSNKTAIVLAALAATLSVVLFAEESAEPATTQPSSFAKATADKPNDQTTNIVAVTQNADGSPNEWTIADLMAALQLQNRRYHRDVRTPDGRRAWHGRLVHQIVDTNACEKVEIYEDGMRFTFPFEAPKPAARPKTTVNSKGVPRRLAELRAKREEEKSTVSNVTVTVTAGE